MNRQPDKQPDRNERRVVVVLTEDEYKWLIGASNTLRGGVGIYEDDAIWQMREAIQHAQHKPGESATLAKAVACLDALTEASRVE